MRSGRKLAVAATLALSLAAVALVVIHVARRLSGPVAATPGPADLSRESRRATPVEAATAAAHPPPAPSVPASEVTHHLSVTLPWPSEPPPTALPTRPERPGPTPTPSIVDCVTLRWWADRASPAPGQVLIEVQADNHCGRDLAPLDVWFVVTGYRGGQEVQTVQGHLFDPLYRNGEGRTAIGLPGSPDWYDDIEVRLVESPRP